MTTFMYVGATAPFGCPLQTIVVAGLREMFVALNDQSILHLALLISIEHISALRGIGLISISQVVTTLIDSHRLMIGLSTQPTPTKIAVTVRSDTDIEDIKELINAGFDCLCPVGLGTDPYESEVAMGRWVRGSKYTPPSVMDRIYKSRNLTNLSYQLTSKQSQILYLIVKKGACNKQLARMTKLAPGTIKHHLSAIYKKYKVTNRTELVIAAKDDV